MKNIPINLLALVFASFITIVPLSGEDARPAPSLTLYNQNFGVVREQVPLSLEAGVNEVSFSEITAHLEPQSVILRDPNNGAGVRILEQNYRNDPVSQELLLQHFEGQEIDFERRMDGERQITRGRIVRAPYVMHRDAMQRFGGQYARTQMRRGTGSSNAPIIEVDGQLRFTLPGLPLFPELGDDSIMKPTLHWQLAANEAFDGKLELSYLSGGFNWAADYNLLIAEEGDKGTLIGWVTMENDSGRTFEYARIKLIAGEVNRVQPENAARSRAMMRAAAESRQEVEQREFDEYHLYTLPRTTTLRTRETKQVEFVRGEDVEARRLYIYNGTGLRRTSWDFRRHRDDQSFGTQSNSKVWVYREVKNTEGNGLGIPLPAGDVRFYRQDVDGGMEFIGEDAIDHTPRNETLRLYTGDAFDLVGERTRTDYERDTSRRTIVESFEIEVRNRKENDSAVIRIVEPLYRWSNWEITEHSDTYRKIDSQTIEFLVQVHPDEEKTVTYTVKYTW